MAKFNLYKIFPEQRGELVSKLESVGLIKTGSKSADGYTLDFYFSNEPDHVDIWWTGVYKDFLTGVSLPQNQIYFATLLVYNASTTYAVGLGKSHFYLKNYCDLDFGLNLAERIIDESNPKIKNSKFYKSRKNKIITTYQKGSAIDFDSGESMHYIKARTTDWEKWGKTASFGHSAQCSLEMSPDNLPNFIKNIEDALSQPPKLKLPKVVTIHDPIKIAELDALLAEAIMPSDADKSEVNVDEFSLSGVDFIFSDQHQYSLYVWGQRGSETEVSDLTIDKLREFVVNNNIDLKTQIDSVKVKVHNEYGRDYSKPLKEFLDFVEERDRYCLIDGRWYQFNQSYIEFLKTEVNKIDTVQKDDVSEENEDQFNKNKAKEGYVNCDKVIETLDKKFKVEKLDLYKDDTIFFVKIGGPRKMNYNIDQSINAVKLLQNNESKINIDNVERKVDNVCLWLIFDRKVKLDKLSEANSLIFQMKLVDWKKIVQNAGFKPIVYVSHKVETAQLSETVSAQTISVV